jgi:hypothetical protein
MLTKPPFGNNLWSNHHKDNYKSKKYSFLEQMIYDDLKNHFSSKHIGLPMLSARILKLCLKNNWYNDILHPPPSKFVYRGLKINYKEKLSNLLKLDQSLIKDKGSVIVDAPVKNDNGFSTSWTTVKKITSDFYTDYNKAKRGFGVILIANVEENKNNLLSGPGGLYNIDGLSRWHLEKETVGIEPVIVHKIEWDKL